MSNNVRCSLFAKIKAESMGDSSLNVPWQEKWTQCAMLVRLLSIIFSFLASLLDNISAVLKYVLIASTSRSAPMRLEVGFWIAKRFSNSE